ncbi:MAG: radical SAM protein [Oscillospiraceae bacterium]|nr:radical SAM protein [Oscillospiraceae bacterium]
MKKHKNISIFIPHAGCPYQCSFCNQRTITAQETLPHAEDVKRICSQALAEMPDSSDTEIAFFGGSFTAIPQGYMLELLESAQEFIGEGKFSGIRISTRPDCISREILEILKSYHVTAIELGAQSMSNRVLQANRRGHTAEQVVKSAKLIQKYGFELGLQVMFGLYQSTWSDELETGWQIRDLHPDTVRIYPVVILKDTRLAEYYQSGYYQLFPFEEAVAFIGQQMMQYQETGIRVIKCGLHASEFVEKDMLAGYYHPAFRELCENHIYLQKINSQIVDALNRKQNPPEVFAVRPDCISKAIGQKRSNLHCLESRYGIKIKIIGDDNLKLYEIKSAEESACI